MPKMIKAEIRGQGLDSLKCLEKALSCLEALCGRQDIGISELARKEGISTSTTHRILTTLTAQGYAVRNKKTGRYRVGHKLFQLTKAALESVQSLALNRQHAKMVCKKSGDRSVFAMLSRCKNTNSCMISVIYAGSKKKSIPSFRKQALARE